jgi:hypothetical protein
VLSDTETTTLSRSLSDYTSLNIGTSGTIASGTVTSLTTESYTDSQSNYVAGSATDSDPEGGPSLDGTITQTSVTTSEVLGVELASEALGRA